MHLGAFMIAAMCCFVAASPSLSTHYPEQLKYWSIAQSMIVYRRLIDPLRGEYIGKNLV